jgi:FixJ family two-component response regulator
MTIPLIGVVDDDEALCSSLADLMRSVGYRSEAFSSAETLLICDDLLNFDCIVADVHMPGMGGLNLIAELRRQGIITPVVLITALSHAHLDGQAMSTGAFCLLRKPFETSSLIACVERSFLI